MNKEHVVTSAGLQARGSGWGGQARQGKGGQGPAIVWNLTSEPPATTAWSVVGELTLTNKQTNKRNKPM